MRTSLRQRTEYYSVFTLLPTRNMENLPKLKYKIRRNTARTFPAIYRHTQVTHSITIIIYNFLLFQMILTKIIYPQCIIIIYKNYCLKTKKKSYSNTYFFKKYGWENVFDSYYYDLC